MMEENMIFGYKEDMGNSRIILREFPTKKSLVQAGFTRMDKETTFPYGIRVVSVQGKKRKDLGKGQRIVPCQWKEFFHMGGL